jgi:hypothetical protein
LVAEAGNKLRGETRIEAIAGMIADQPRGELLISGARPRRARIGGVKALTASGRRVAQLAAEV